MNCFHIFGPFKLHVELELTDKHIPTLVEGNNMKWIQASRLPQMPVRYQGKNQPGNMFLSVFFNCQLANENCS